MKLFPDTPKNIYSNNVINKLLHLLMTEAHSNFVFLVANVRNFVEPVTWQLNSPDFYIVNYPYSNCCVARKFRNCSI